MLAHHQTSGIKTTVVPGDPNPLFHTGVMENALPGVFLPEADLQPGMIRLLRREINNIAVAKQRTSAILNAGVALMPTIGTEGWQSNAVFEAYLREWLDHMDTLPNPPLWVEVGNEPGGELPNPKPPEATIRANYLARMVIARDVLDDYGKKLILSAITGAAGGTQNMLTDISNNVSGSDFDMIDGVGCHTYNWAVNAAQLGSLDRNIYNCFEDSIIGFRNRFDTNGLSDRPMWITETGFTCATRAAERGGGGNPGDWSGTLGPNQPTGTDAGGRRSKVISLALQADYLRQTMQVAASHRNDLKLRCCLWYTGIDNGDDWPTGEYDKHCGIMDGTWATGSATPGRRASYFALRDDVQRSYAVT